MINPSKCPVAKERPHGERCENTDHAHHSLNAAKRKYCRPQIHPSHQSPKRSDNLVRHRVPANESVMYFFSAENNVLLALCTRYAAMKEHFFFCLSFWIVKYLSPERPFVGMEILSGISFSVSTSFMRALVWILISRRKR